MGGFPRTTAVIESPRAISSRRQLALARWRSSALPSAFDIEAGKNETLTWPTFSRSPLTICSP